MSGELPRVGDYVLLTDHAAGLDRLVLARVAPGGALASITVTFVRSEAEVRLAQDAQRMAAMSGARAFLRREDGTFRAL